MRVWLSFIFLIVFAALPAAAAERVLLSGPPGGTGLGPASTLPALAKAFENGQVTVRIIVGLSVPFAAEGELQPDEVTVQRQEIADAVTVFRGRYSVAVARAPQRFRSYDTLPFVAIDVTADELARIAADPGVINVYEDRQNRPSISDSVPQIGGPVAWSRGYNGSGQTVAVIDSGIYRSDYGYVSDVRPSQLSDACFSIGGICPGGVTRSTAPLSGVPCFAYGCGHGSWSADIILANSHPLYKGVAWAGNILSIQVFSPDGAEGVTAYTSDILAALEHVFSLNGSKAIAAVNLSLGQGRYVGACDTAEPALAAAVANLRAAGVATIAASGNDGWTDSLNSPACLSGVISVGAVFTSPKKFKASNAMPCSDSQEVRDRVTCYSNTSPALSLLAPGGIIWTQTAEWKSTPNLELMQGTSLATAHVSGAWALMRQKLPNASVSEILAILQRTGKPIADHRVPGIITPRIDVGEATRADYIISFSVTGAGTGSVSITTSFGTTLCTSACSVPVSAGEQVTATAAPAAGSLFTGWAGACSGRGSCSFTAAPNASLVASFSPPQVFSLIYQRQGSGSSVVDITTASGVKRCAASCVLSVTEGTTVSARAVPLGSYSFTGWSGACQGTGNCSFTVTGNSQLGASFAPPTASLGYVRLGTGSGRASFTTGKARAVCDQSCTQTYPVGTVVRLLATEAAGSRFEGWTGGNCGQARICFVTLGQSTTVSATFTKK